MGKLRSMVAVARHQGRRRRATTDANSLSLTLTATMHDFQLTIDSDDEGGHEQDLEDTQKPDDLAPDFSLDLSGLGQGGETDWGKDIVQNLGEQSVSPPPACGPSFFLGRTQLRSRHDFLAPQGVGIDDIIARRRSTLLSSGVLKPLKPSEKRKRVETVEDDSDADEEGDEDDGSSEGQPPCVQDNTRSAERRTTDGFGAGVAVEGGSDSSDDDDPLDSDGGGDEEDPLGSDDDDDNDDGASVASSSSSTSSTHETQAQRERKAAFFSDDPSASASSSSHLPATFAAMNLSRPLLRNITALNFVSPTPIQSRAIPLALLGRDILGSAVTGSGKTAAFMIPVLERMLYREKGKGGKGSASRVLVLCPTRELAVQCEAVGKALSAGMDIRFALLVGQWQRLCASLAVLTSSLIHRRWSVPQRSVSAPPHLARHPHRYPRSPDRSHPQLSLLYPRRPRRPDHR